MAEDTGGVCRQCHTVCPDVFVVENGLFVWIVLSDRVLSQRAKEKIDSNSGITHILNRLCACAAPYRHLTLILVMSNLQERRTEGHLSPETPNCKNMH